MTVWRALEATLVAAAKTAWPLVQSINRQAGSNLTADAVRAWVEDVLQFDERGSADEVRHTVTVAICTRDRPWPNNAPRR